MKSVMIVDDSLDIRQLVRQILELEGYSVCEACDGQEALEILRENRSALPGLIFLDQMMPNVSGQKFVEQLVGDDCADLQKIPIYILSATSQKFTQFVLGFLRKPIDLEALISVVEKHCR